MSENINTARNLAHETLTADGWTYNTETAEYTHTDGRRGRLAFIPADAASVTDARNYNVSRVELHQPGRRPTIEELQNRVNTAPAPIVIATF